MWVKMFTNVIASVINRLFNLWKRTGQQLSLIIMHKQDFFSNGVIKTKWCSCGCCNYAHVEPQIHKFNNNCSTHLAEISGPEKKETTSQSDSVMTKTGFPSCVIKSEHTVAEKQHNNKGFDSRVWNWRAGRLIKSHQRCDVFTTNSKKT